MTIESSLFAVLSPLVGGRVFPDDAPFDTQRPYIIYQQVGGVPVNYTTQQVPSGQHGLFQVSVWADSRIAASALQLQVEDALRISSTFATLVETGPTALREADLGRYGTRQEFSFWSAR